MMDEPERLVGMRDDICRRPEGDQLVSRLRKIDHSVRHHLTEHGVRVFHEWQPDRLRLMAALLQLRGQPVDYKSRASVDERHERRAQRHFH
jgi:hypothetical protein